MFLVFDILLQACLVFNLRLIILSSDFSVSIWCNNYSQACTLQNIWENRGGKFKSKLQAMVLSLANSNLLFLKVQRSECVSQAPHGLFVYFQRTVGGKEQVFKPGQDGDILLRM